MEKPEHKENKKPLYLSTFFRFKDEIKQDLKNRDYILIGLGIIDLVIIVTLTIFLIFK